MTLQEFKNKLDISPEKIIFQDTLNVIENSYHFQPTAFTNGELKNKEGENSGSCKLFAFCKLQYFTQQQTLMCFGEHYRNVLSNPDGNDHQNIRNFMEFGWKEISFTEFPLSSTKK